MRLSAEARVGLVVVAGIVLLTYMTFTVSGWRWGTQKGYLLHAVFRSVAGLDAKSTVKLAGVEVGKVEEIRLQGNQARVTLRLQPDIQIQRGSRGAIRASGLLGEKYLEIIPGDGEGFHEPGEELEDTLESASLEGLMGKFSAIDIEGLIDQIKSVFDDIKAVTISFRAALGTQEGEASIKEIVYNIRELTGNLNSLVKNNQEGVSESVDNIRSFTQDLRDGIPGIIEKIDAITAKLENGEGTLGKLLKDEAVYDRLDSVLENLETISGRLESGEGTIGKLLTKDEAYESLTKTLEGLGEAMTRLRETKVFVQARNEFQLEEGENKGYFSIRIDPRPNKSYLLEVVDDPRGEITEEITQVDTNPPVVELKTKRKLKFSALFARRFSGFTIKAGLMENSFGVGAEYSLLKDRFQIGFDAWDFNSDDPQMDKVRLKAVGRYSPFRYLFVQGGYDNFLNRDIDTFFVGAGFRFEDNDLKYLIGSFPISP